MTAPTARERLLRLLADNPDPDLAQSDALLRGWMEGLTEGAAVTTPPAADEGLRRRIADLLVDRCPDHGCVEPEWSACHCELSDALLPLFAAERDAAYRDGQAQSPDESVQINGVKYRDAANARAAGAFSQHPNQP